MRRFLLVIAGWLLILATTVHGSGSFDRRDYPYSLAGDHVHLFYAKTGPNGVTEAYARSVLDLAEQAYTALVTEGGLRPPRVLPIPIAIRAEDPSLGGAVNPAEYGYDLWMKINPRMNEPKALAEVVAHEMFHVLQSSYQKGGPRPDWAIEGTAAAAVPYVLGDDAETMQMVMTGHLGQCWAGSSMSLKENKYGSSLFWYWVSARYGGVSYVDRLLAWSEDVEWERAAQLAALEGGAPPETTFDTLWRSFVLDMVAGRMPEGYQTDKWFQPQQLQWKGFATELKYGERRTGVGKLDYGYGYQTPLKLPVYGFELVEILHKTGTPVDLTVGGDTRSVEAYVIKPGPGLSEALKNSGKRPGFQRVMAPPSDPGTIGVRLEPGKPVLLTGQPEDRTLVLFMRLGNWGHGGYSLELTPATEVRQQPVYTALDQIPHGPDSPLSPPALTEDERKALAAGTWLTGTLPLLADEPELLTVKRLTITVGESSVGFNDTTAQLPVPVMRDEQGVVWFPARALAQLLGAQVTGNRFTLGDQWVDVVPGAREWHTQSGRFVPQAAARLMGEELLVPHDFFIRLGASLSWSGDTYRIVYPRVR